MPILPRRRIRSKKIDGAMLTKLWYTRMSLPEIGNRMGHTPQALRRHAVAKLGLPSCRKNLWNASVEDVAHENG